MNRQALTNLIFEKKSALCVGLDTDPSKVPGILSSEPDPVFAFNKAIIDATVNVAVAYKINTAFYEAQGLKGWISLQKTLEYLPRTCFSIADAKRGDIGNTSEQYARTFFEVYPFDSITVAPYMGRDSVAPFLAFPGKWTIILGLTSNEGSRDFQQLPCGNELLYQHVLRTAASWGNPGNTMFVTGATHSSELRAIRQILPEHFFLVPGVGAQGGDIETVFRNAANKDCGLLVNVSRNIIYAGNGADFAEKAQKAAESYHYEMRPFF